MTRKRFWSLVCAQEFKQKISLNKPYLLNSKLLQQKVVHAQHGDGSCGMEARLELGD